MNDRFTLFISDIHLSETRADITHTFKRFLNKFAVKSDAIYILGDLFDAWIGDDNINDFNLDIVQSLKQVTQTGTPVYFMAGNRDFLIGKQFCSKTNITLLNDPSVIKLYHQPLLLSHGDYLCTDDKSHQIYRRIISHPISQWLITATPLSLRQWGSRTIRKNSQQRNQRLNDEKMDVSAKTVTKIMNQFNVTQLIHGHTHKPAIHQLNDNKQRIVLGDWHHAGSYLIYYANGQYGLETI